MLQTLLGEEVFSFLILFVRVSPIFSLAPALGERSIPVPVRLSAALAVSFAMLPAMDGRLPPIPGTIFGLGGLILHEIFVGLFLAVIGQLVQSALQTAGTIVAFMGGLAFAQQFDPFQGFQSAITSSFFTIMGVTLIFVTDLHLLLFEAIFDSYLLFPPQSVFPIDDAMTMIITTAAEGFELGLKMSAPFVTYGLVFYAGLGIISRLIPRIQIFFVALPLNIMASLIILLIALPGIMMGFLMMYEEIIGALVLQ